MVLIMGPAKKVPLILGTPIYTVSLSGSLLGSQSQNRWPDDGRLRERAPAQDPNLAPNLGFC